MIEAWKLAGPPHQFTVFTLTLFQGTLTSLKQLEKGLNILSHHSYSKLRARTAVAYSINVLVRQAAKLFV